MGVDVLEADVPAVIDTNQNGDELAQEIFQEDTPKGQKTRRRLFANRSTTPKPIKHTSQAEIQARIDALNEQKKKREEAGMQRVDPEVKQKLDNLVFKPVLVRNKPVLAYEQRGKGGVERRMMASGNDAGKVVVYAEATIPDSDIAIPLDQVGETVVTPRFARIEKDKNGGMTMTSVPESFVKGVIDMGAEIYGLDVDETTGDFKPSTVALPVDKDTEIDEVYEAAHVVAKKADSNGTEKQMKSQRYQQIRSERGGPFTALLPEQNDSSTWFEKTVDLDTDTIPTGDLVLVQHKVPGDSNEDEYTEYALYRVDVSEKNGKRSAKVTELSDYDIRQTAYRISNGEEVRMHGLKAEDQHLRVKEEVKNVDDSSLQRRLKSDLDSEKYTTQGFLEIMDWR